MSDGGLRGRPPTPTGANDANLLHSLGSQSRDSCEDVEWSLIAILSNAARVSEPTIVDGYHSKAGACEPTSLCIPSLANAVRSRNEDYAVIALAVTVAAKANAIRCLEGHNTWRRIHGDATPEGQNDRDYAQPSLLHGYPRVSFIGLTLWLWTSSRHPSVVIPTHHRQIDRISGAFA